MKNRSNNKIRLSRVNFATTEDLKGILKQLAAIKERSVSNTLEYLIRQEARAEGLIEPVNNLLEK